MTQTINKDTKTLVFEVASAPTSAPTLNLRRIGGTVVVTAPFVRSIGNKYTFGVVPSSLKPGRYYALVNFGGCCCLKTEVFVDTSCNLTNVSTTSAVSGCATC
jgi:hypothetical protein